MLQSRLLRIKHQNPTVRRRKFSEAINQAAITVANIAGHCSQSIKSTRPPINFGRALLAVWMAD
jgi:hypothetical protein